MEKIGKFLSTNSKYQRLSRPLEAARVCEAARAVAKGRFDVLSFRDGLLTLGSGNSSEAANLQLASDQIIEEINAQIGQELVRRLRFKIV